MASWIVVKDRGLTSFNSDSEWAGLASWGADYLLGVSQVVQSRWWVRTLFLYSLAFVHLCVLSLNRNPNGRIGPVMSYGHKFA